MKLVLYQSQYYLWRMPNSIVDLVTDWLEWKFSTKILH